MLSQYSWGDFIKVVLVILFVYYAYVLWTYYRQDIWDWFTNRGTNSDLQPAIDESEEEIDHSSLYQVATYSAPAPIVAPVTMKESVAKTPEVDPPSEPAAHSGNNQVAKPVAPPTDEAPAPDLNGMAINDDEPTDFTMTIVVETDRPAEQSVAVLIDAAQRLETNAEGVLVPTVPADVVAAGLADVINQQQGRSALAGISFNR